MEKVLVMGGSYFIGRTLVDRLLEKEYDVYTLNRGSRPVWNGRIHNLICDRNDGERLKEVLARYQFDFVVDVSGLNGKQATDFMEALPPQKLKKFIFLSSSAVYDVERLTIPYRETDSLAENCYWTFYGRGKIDAEEVYRKHFADTSTQLLILRPPYVYGEYNYVQRESFVFDHLQKGLPVLVPASNCKLQFIYVKDLAEIICRLLERASFAYSVYNVGNREAVSCREWVDYCAEAAELPIDCRLYDYDKDGYTARDFFPFFDYDNVLDISRIQCLDFPETNFIEGLKNSFQWYLQNRENILWKEQTARNEEQIRKKLGLKPLF